MNDRELLELAAKAAGYANAEWKEYSNAPPTMTVPYDQPVNGITGFLWNPLTDDGDALRLAAKLNLDIEFATSAWPDNESGVMRIEADMPTTRRAIVRAAAEIGRAMP